MKRVTQGFRVRGSWRPNINCNILTPKLMAVNVVSFSFSRAAQPRGPGPTLLGAVFLYCILSASSLDPNSSGPQAPSAWCGFPYHTRLSPSPTVCNLTGRQSQLALNSTGTWLPSWLRYIIIQRLHDRPLDLWNRMFNCHQAEITVM